MKLFHLSIILLILNSVCYNQWILQESNTSFHLFGVYMIDANTGFVAGDYQTIRKTTDGGLNWNTVMPIPNLDYGKISFLNAYTGVIAAGPGARMIQTYDGGSTWINRFPSDYPGKVQYIDSMILYATGGYSVMKSADGGISWFQINGSIYYGHFRGLYFINKDTGTVVGADALIQVTTDGGNSWGTRIVFFPPIVWYDSTLYDVQFVNALTGYACGNNGIVIKTTNGGINWTFIPTAVPPSPLHALFGVYFTDTNIGTVAGDLVIWRTTDGGNNWISQPYPFGGPLTDVDFVSTDTGWIVGFNGLILYTSDGGMTWIKPISNDVPSGFKLEQNYPNPFNPTTKIKFSIPKTPLPPFRKGGIITLKIYDILGREVATLVNEKLQPGTYEVTWDGSNYPSGVYYYKLEAGDYKESKKMILMK